MANAKKCDRCNKFYNRYNEGEDPKKINALIPSNVNDKGRYFGHKEIELCPDCMEEFKGWLSRIHDTEIRAEE